MRHIVAIHALLLLGWTLAPPAAPARVGVGSRQRPAEALRSSGASTLLPGVPGLHLGPAGSTHATQGADEALIIKMTYRAVATAALRSGHDLRFDVDAFETHYRDEFQHLFLTDLVSLSATTLGIEYTEVSHGEAHEDIFLGAAYEPAWKTLEGDLAEQTASLGNYTYEEILRLAAAEPETAVDDPGEIVAVTTYRVRASFEERSVDYRAMFVWLADRDGAVRFLPQDYVTERVDQIWELSQRAAPMESLLRNQPAPSPSLAQGEVE